ncbi:MAG: hypothetical protein DI603_22535 [Roseateles depolymerans]|uniref:Haem-binding uptake Tiki superfamily ChaN domain-containing protein n=1 Tax=Roseateles depolymerans TaxID=76731 RepID=A0A2W5DFI6_9BURK|nr:MAG: hypothetical protein DI603_22535 [Roseateles depolymerans]
MSLPIVLTALIAFLLATTGWVALHLTVDAHHHRVFGTRIDAGRRLRLRAAGLACLACPMFLAVHAGWNASGLAWSLPLVAAGLSVVPCTVLRRWSPRAMPIAGSGALAAAALLTLPLAWGAAASPAPLVAARSSAPPLLLFGEVHDNVQQHALRLQVFKTLLDSGARPALLMEQFDREHQETIDHLRNASRGGVVDAQRLIDAATTPESRWAWELYRPYIELALAHDLPILAANVSRRDARLVAARGLAALGFDAAVPSDIARRQAELIVASHCGWVDEAQALPMAQAQIARDQFMARLLEQQLERGAVLFAGNGHVRRDFGVPRWLSPPARARAVSIGLLEEGDEDSGNAFDRAVTTPRQPREDPCASMRDKPVNAKQLRA